MKRAKILSAAFLTITLINLIQSPAFAATYYISPTGNDGNNGRSLKAAFRTIQKAANISKAGDIIKIQPGTYNEQVNITKSGTAKQVITYQASWQVIIDAQNTRPYCIKIAGADYIKIEGFTCRCAANNGILLDNQANYNIITQNTLHNNKESGLKITNKSSYNTISKNTFHHNTGGANSYGYRISAVYIFNSSNYNTITANDIYANNGGIWLEGSSSNCTITNNKTHDNTCGGIIIVGATNNNTIANNLSYNNKAFGLELGYSAKNNLVKNNTIYGNLTNGLQLNNAAANNIIKNNIIVKNGSAETHYGIKIEAGLGAKISYNDIYNNGKTGAQNYGGIAYQGEGDISVDPKFKSTDPQSPDYLKLKSRNNGDDIDSPCIDFGDPQNTPSLESYPRIDIGAYDIYTVYTPGLIANWRFNENTGTAIYDCTPYHNHAVINGALRQEGVFGRTLYFDGKDDFALVSDNKSFGLTDTCTIETVIKIGALNSGKNCIISKPGAFWFYIHQDAKVALEECVRWEGIWSNASLKPNEWYHLVGVWDKIGNKKQIYINGNLDNEGIPVNAFSVSSQKLAIGNYGAAGGMHYFNGTIDELKIYNCALSESEIKKNYSYYSSTLVNPLFNVLQDYTLSRNIKLTATCKAADKMMISENANFQGGVWQGYIASKNWQLSSGYGEKTIYAKFKNQTGESVAISDTVLYLKGGDDWDGDGITNGEEIARGQDGYITDPTKVDTDGDGTNDLQEIINGSSPLDPNTTPPTLTIDSPRDGEVIF